MSRLETIIMRRDMICILFKGASKPSKVNKGKKTRARVPQNKQYKDWIRSEVLNGGTPKVSINNKLLS